MLARVVARGGRRAVFTGVARNCAPFLRDVLPNLRRLESAYHTVRYVVAVGESYDGTSETLKKWVGGRQAGHVIDMSSAERGEARRTMRIAMGRNACMSLLHDVYPDFDHVVVVDFDDVLVDPVCDAEFLRAGDWLEADDRRAGVFANAVPQYYDIWALRHPSWCPYDVWHAIWDRRHWCPFELAKFWHVYAKQVPIPRNAGPIPVLSAFGGLSIYKKRFIRKAHYSGQDAAGRVQAEHVSFNSSIVGHGGDLFVLPSLVVRAPQEHLFDITEASAWLKLAVGLKDRRFAARHPC